MVDYNTLPQTTIRHDPWSKANMMGQVPHCAIAEEQKGILQVGVENNGNMPCVMAVSFNCSVAFRASLSTNASFTTSGEAYQYLLNRYAHETVLDEHSSNYVIGDLRFWRTLGNVSSTYTMNWYGAAGQLLTPFGPNGFTGQFVVVDPSEDLILTITREDGLDTDQFYGMYITWTGFDPNTVAFGTPV